MYGKKIKGEPMFIEQLKGDCTRFCKTIYRKTVAMSKSDDLLVKTALKAVGVAVVVGILMASAASPWGKGATIFWATSTAILSGSGYMLYEIWNFNDGITGDLARGAKGAAKFVKDKLNDAGL
jgi:hypothetical protein